MATLSLARFSDFVDPQQMKPGDPVTAPRWRGGKITQGNDAVYVGPGRDRHERDRSDGEILVFAQTRVRYPDGEEAEWDEAFVRSRN